MQLLADSASPLFQGASQNDTGHGKNAKRTKMRPSAELCAVLYGPISLAEVVGIFVAKCRLYLQHPKNCDRNVPYRNPHCLSIEDSRTIFTSDLDDLVGDGDTNVIASANPIDLFADDALHNALADASAPSMLSTELYKHQKQALTFMIQREHGWALDGHHKDIWKEEKSFQGRIQYHNIICGFTQTRPPRQFYGGLLIDAPGLGKSLSILALIASGTEKQTQCIHDRSYTYATLVIVPKTCKCPVDHTTKPLSLTRGVIQMWKDELQKWDSPSMDDRLLINWQTYTFKGYAELLRLLWKRQGESAQDARQIPNSHHYLFRCSS